MYITLCSRMCGNANLALYELNVGLWCQLEELTCKQDIPAIFEQVVPELHKFIVLAVGKNECRSTGHQILQPAGVTQTRDMQQVPAHINQRITGLRVGSCQCVEARDQRKHQHEHGGFSIARHIEHQQTDTTFGSAGLDL